ncbi:HEAT repeat domain-containing protein [Jiulongibacter sp. NS-SX5]|uniref:HEAT repeat domain-containing protein n=1 Tax=Jiulongibacter sp. NS-SX5 TaxID=3463854 RepID=UPI0040584EDE
MSLSKKDMQEALIINFIEGRLSEEEKSAFLAEVEKSAAFKKNLEETQTLWAEMGAIEIPEPSAALLMNFETQLVEEMEKANKSDSIDIIAKLKALFAPQSKLGWAYGLVLIGLASMVGFYVGRGSQKQVASTDKVEQLSQEMEEMKQLMMISMLENPMASERMKAVSYTKEIDEVDEQVINALMTTLNQDENVNVRLATLEALVELSDHPKVREGLVQSIVHQESPLVQVALADVMVQLQEKRSVKQIKELLKQNGLNETVKEKLEETITGLEV